MRHRSWFLLALSVAVMGSVACNKTKPPAVAKKLALPDSASQVIFGMKLFFTDRGVNKGQLLADTAYGYDDASGKRYELRRVHVTFYTPEGLDDGTLVSQTGTYNERLNRVEVRGAVIVTRKDGDHLETPQLVYDQARNQLFSDSSFVLTRPSKQIMSGVQFESDPHLSNFKCFKNCKGTAPVKVPR